MWLQPYRCCVIALASLAVVAAMFVCGLDAAHGQDGEAAAVKGKVKGNDGSAYNPLAIDGVVEPRVIDLVCHDAKRDRDVPLQIYLPAIVDPAPVILFSHGLGGSPEAYTYLGQYWSMRGYVVVMLQHPGSDVNVWKGKRLLEMKRAINAAANYKNFMFRVHDVQAVLDQLERWQNDPAHELHQRLDLQNVGMAGHSFGAMTTQAVSGQTFPGRGQALTDARIDAAIPMSPSPPKSRASAAAAFADVVIPWLCMTGTRDVASIGHTTVDDRLAVYHALPTHQSEVSGMSGASKTSKASGVSGEPGAANHYELLLHDGEHLAFTDRQIRAHESPRHPNHHRAILATSTAFWDAYLRNDQAAKQWLQQAGPSPSVDDVLETQDRWQFK